MSKQEEDKNVDLLFQDIWPALTLSQQRILSANRLTEVLIGVGVTVTVTTVALAEDIQPWSCSLWWLAGACLCLFTALAIGFYSRTITGFTMLDLGAFLDPKALGIETKEFQKGIVKRASERIADNEHALHKKYRFTQGMFIAYFAETVLVAIWLLVR